MTKPDVKVYELEVGCVYYGTIRDILKRWKLQGADIRWEEGSGWLSRIFYIAGKDALQFCRKINSTFN